MILQEHFRRRVQAELDERDWSQSDLAREMGVTRSVVSQYLTGRITPGLDVVERFAKAFGFEENPLDLLVEKSIREKHQSVS